MGRAPNPSRAEGVPIERRPARDEVRVERSLVSAGLTLVLALSGFACGDGEPEGGTATTSTTGAGHTEDGSEGGFSAAYSRIREAYAHMYMTGDGLVTAIDAQKNLAGEVKTQAADLRITLDRLLGEHALLAAFVMQKGFDGAPDFEAAAAALEQNSQELADAIGSVYGEEARNAFLKQWRDHIRMLVDFTVATAESDKRARQKALDELALYQASFSEFMANATGAPAETVSGLLQEHVMQLTAALDTYGAEDYAGAYAQVRDAYAHMFTTGDALARAIDAQKKLPGDVKTPAVDLRQTFDWLLAEHALLVAFVMQKGLDGSPDFTPLAEALDKNSVVLGDAIGSAYGQDAENAFLQQWRAHIRMFTDFTKATAAKDMPKRDAALNELSQYRVSFADFLSKATGGNLPANSVADLLQVHVDQLSGALDAYAGAKAA